MNVYGPKNVVYVSIPGYTARYGFRTSIEPVAASAFGQGAEYVFDQKTAPLIGDLDADVLWGDYTRPRVNSFYLANDLILDGSNKGKPLRAKTTGETEGTISRGRQMSSFIHTPVTAALPPRWTIIGGNAL